MLRKREGEIILISRNEIYPYLLSFQKLRVLREAISINKYEKFGSRNSKNMFFGIFYQKYIIPVLYVLMQLI